MAECRKQFGKIRKASYGFGGYQDAQFGISFDLGGEHWGVSDFWGGWADKPTSGAQWTRKDQLAWHAETAERICELLKAAKVNSVAKLPGIPIEVSFDGNLLKSWRVLTEVL